MIRINLLPQKRAAAQTEQSQAWIGVVMGVLLVQAVGLFFFHQSKQNELARQKQQNQEISNQIAEIQKTVANHANVMAQLAIYRQREEAIDKLQAGRTGPTAVLLEVAQVMTTGRSPTVANPDTIPQLRKDNPLALPSPSWDARRLWILSYKETDRVVTIEGLARDGEDVSELARRLSLSDYFEQVKLLPAAKVKVDSKGTNVEMLKFQLQAKVRY